jgi:hypothetical protein
LKRRREVKRLLDAAPGGLGQLYRKLLEPRYTAAAHHRNAFLVEAVPFLYRAVAPSVVLRLVEMFYDLNAEIFNDSVEQHMAEAQALLKGVAETYESELPTTEREIYEALVGDDRVAFRIFLDLATSDESSNSQFFMSCDQLGFRLSIASKMAWELLNRFMEVGLLEQLVPGERRARGVVPRAGEYVWLIGGTAKKI